MVSMVSRGLGKTTSLALPRGYNNVLLKLAEEKKCPELKSLSVNIADLTDGFAFIKSLGKWKLLEELRLEGGFYYADFPKLVAVIGKKCKNFNSLAVYNSGIRDEDALAIAVHLQKIKKMIMANCFVEQENLENIIWACKELEVLVVKKCTYTKSWEEKKLRSLGSHIKTLILNAYLEEYYDICGHDSEDDVFDVSSD